MDRLGKPVYWIFLADALLPGEFIHSARHGRELKAEPDIVQKAVCLTGIIPCGFFAGDQFAQFGNSAQVHLFAGLPGFFQRVDLLLAQIIRMGVALLKVDGQPVDFAIHFRLAFRGLYAGKVHARFKPFGFKNRFDFREGVDFVVTEYGVASLKGLTLRERAQALIEIAHPGDRSGLIEAAKSENILYRDQICLPESALYYPSHIDVYHQFKGDVTVRFRPIRPSDEEAMRRLFYRFSDEAVYYRYFSSLKAMPHTRMQTYVNVDWRNVMSIVGVVGKIGEGIIVSEARYLADPHGDWAEVAFVVDEPYQSIGIATFVFKLLVQLAQERGIRGFWADVLVSNTSMMKVFSKSGLTVLTEMDNGVYHVSIPFND